MQHERQGATGHLADPAMAAYLLGSAGAAEQAGVEGHCLNCDQCRAHLAILMRVFSPARSAEDQRRLAALFARGRPVAIQVRHQDTSPPAQSRARAAASALEVDLSGLGRGARHQSWRHSGRWPYLVPGLAVLLLAAVCLYLHFALPDLSPAAGGLEVLRHVYRHSRPTEARVTGGFDHQPFERTRGPATAAGVDPVELDAALARLSQAVLADPSPDNRHALGRLHLLRGEFDLADRQFSLALKDRPQEAQLQADLSALYYERSLAEQDEEPRLLATALGQASRAIELDPKLAEAWFNRALCQERLNLFTAAHEDWEQYLRLDSDSPWAEEARAHLKRLRERAEGLTKLDQCNQVEFLATEAVHHHLARRLLAERLMTVKH